MSVHANGTNALHAHTFNYMASSSATERLDSKILPFLHFRHIPSLYDRYRLSAMDLIHPNGVPRQVSD